MGLTQEVGRIWNIKIVRREETNTTWMQQALEVDTETIYPKNRIAAVLHRFIKAGCAEKGKTRSSYKKLRNFKPRRTVVPKLTTEEVIDSFKEQPIEPIAEPIDLLTLGKSILAIIDDFKTKITELRKQLSEEKKTVRELVEQKRELEELYKKAQMRILELNTGGNKTFKLGELQNFRDGLAKL